MILISQKFFNMFQSMKVHHYKPDAECMHYGIMLFPNICDITVNHNMHYIKVSVDMQWWKQSCGWKNELGTFIMTNAISWPAQFLYSEISPYNST